MKLNIFAAIAAALALQIIPAALAQALPPGLAPPPACAVNCSVQNVPSICGSLTNITCICTDPILESTLAACVVANCTLREALATKRFSDITCQRPVKDRTLSIYIVMPVFGFLALIVFGLRVLARGLIGWHSWGLDDWLMIPCVILSIPMLVLLVILTKYGLGKDIWMIEDQEDITTFLHVYYWVELVYLAIIPLAKMSILAFYLRIFPDKNFRRWAYVLMAVNVLYLVIFEIITIAQCTPIEGAWLHWDGEFDTTCRDLNLQAWMAAAICLVLDVATLVLPLPQLLALRMSLRKKIRVLSMFCVGFFVTLVAVLRLQSLLTFSQQSSNVTMDFVDISVWSTVEISVGIICACMPALRSLLSLAMPSAFGITEQRQSASPAGESGKSGKSGRKGSGSGGLSSILSNKSGGGGVGIRVKSEFTVRTKQRDESTFIELQALDAADHDDDTRGTMAGTMAMAATAKAGSIRDSDEENDGDRRLSADAAPVRK
ncbi:CFEM domain-containing protein [Microdochium nivale]|nr:CFEM domain-containing protein [Microdochium nivale]